MSMETTSFTPPSSAHLSGEATSLDGAVPPANETVAAHTPSTPPAEPADDSAPTAPPLLDDAVKAFQATTARAATTKAAESKTAVPLADDAGGETVVQVALSDAVQASNERDELRSAATRSKGAQVIPLILTSVIFVALVFAAILARSLGVIALLCVSGALVGGLFYTLSRDVAKGERVVQTALSAIDAMSPIVESFVKLRTEKFSLVAMLTLREQELKAFAKRMKEMVPPEMARIILRQYHGRHPRLMPRNMRFWRNGRERTVVNFLDPKFAAKGGLHFVMRSNTDETDYFAFTLPTGEYVFGETMLFRVDAEQKTVSIFVKRKGAWNFEDTSSVRVLDVELRVAGYVMMISSTQLAAISALGKVLPKMLQDREMLESRTVLEDMDGFSGDSTDDAAEAPPPVVLPRMPIVQPMRAAVPAPPAAPRPTVPQA